MNRSNPMVLGVGSRLAQPPADIVRRLTFATKEAALPEHADLFDAMARVNLAHVVMLHDRGLAPAAVSKALAAALLDIWDHGMAAVPLRAEAGDLYPQIEAHLSGTLGPDIAGYLQLGRSRGDVIPAAMRLKLRIKTHRLLNFVLPLRAALLELARKHTRTILPAYTHWQQSQIMTFAHFLGRWAAWFQRDFDRLFECMMRHNLSPLGSANGVGTSVRVDRSATAALLGHIGPVPLAGDAVYAWDYMIEPVTHAALFCSNASRLVGNFILWHTQEFATVSLSDAFATASTYLPHKRNPEPLETVKAFAELAAGDLTTVYMMTRNEDWPHSLINHGYPAINRSLDLAKDAAELTTAILRDISIDVGRMRELAVDSFATVSEVANVLVAEAGIPFRQAHEIVGSAVRMALQSGLTRISVDHIRRAAREHVEADIAVDEKKIMAALDGDEFVRRMRSPGGTSPAETEAFLKACGNDLKRDAERLRAFNQRLDEADRNLRRRAEQIQAS